MAKKWENETKKENVNNNEKEQTNLHACKRKESKKSVIKLWRSTEHKAITMAHEQ